MMVFAAGCSAPPAAAPPTSIVAPVLSPPSEDLTVVDDADAAAAALQASAALFQSSPVAVIADQPQVLAGASVSVALGVPLFSAAADPAALEAELDRLGTGHLVMLGEPPENFEAGDRSLVAPAPTETSLEQTLGIDFEVREVTAGESIAAVGGLTAAEPVLLLPSGGATDFTSPPDDSGSAQLPPLGTAEPLSGAVALVLDEPAALPALATVRAAGADVVRMSPNQPNPQASATAIEALAAHPEDPVLVLGAGFARETSLDWKIRSARTGLQLSGGGQLLFPSHLMVALYGTPGTPSLGVLGEQDLPASIDRARRHADAYTKLTDKTVLPGFEVIATVASGSAGSDGDYSNELDPVRLGEWAKAATAAGMYVILDLQPGRTDFVTQAKQYESILTLPWVGLALDPEWRLAPGEKHLVNIGSVHSSEVNAVEDYLAGLVREHSLPPKLMVLHQFRSDMVTDRAGVEVDHDEVTVLIHADGQGSQPEKQATWKRLHTDAPDVAWGWKNFYDEDKPMLDARHTMQVKPLPNLITYQ
jgi:hypothetical protein